MLKLLKTKEFRGGFNMNLIRQDKIKEYIESKSVATIKEIQGLFPDVSLMTIHRDLNA